MDMKELREAQFAQCEQELADINDRRFKVKRRMETSRIPDVLAQGERELAELDERANDTASTLARLKQQAA